MKFFTKHACRVRAGWTYSRASNPGLFLHKRPALFFAMSDTPSATAELTLPKDLAAAKGMVNVQIDGIWHQFPKGTRMIEACRQARITVPHYCYHPKLSSPGNCRMCLVQMGMPPRPAPGQEPQRDENGYEIIGWMPRPVIACANTIGENMGIRTTGELVEKCREGVMEFLLINHPLDCPICDQAGECRLQEQSVQHGRGVSRFVDMKVKKPKNVDIGPRIRLDDERCIMCSRCIRFMDEVASDPVLGFTQRGTHTTLTVHPGRLLDSNYSLNTADICPVGALTSNDFRFQMRVWFLKETPTIDVNCGTGTNITVWARGNKIHRITPRQNDEVNSAWMPDSHRLNFHYIDSTARLTEPLVWSSSVSPSNFVATTWQAALTEAATRIKAIPAEQTAIIASARMTNEELFLAIVLAGKIGTTQLSLVPRLDEGDMPCRRPRPPGKRIWRGRSSSLQAAARPWKPCLPAWMAASPRSTSGCAKLPRRLPRRTTPRRLWCARPGQSWSRRWCGCARRRGRRPIMPARRLLRSFRKAPPAWPTRFEARSGTV